ncbi:Hypothetical protein PBC10988_21130 [Planctomycetales bacterium 10988]|nr:Hypothetical protein PBC10988_21130 [Planctomycetales bacterium 10988]
MLWQQFLPSTFKQSQVQKERDTPLRLEQLESRQLLAADPLLINVNPAGNGYPSGFEEVNGTAFFVANGGTTGMELWRSEGTSGTTQLVKDIRVGANNSYTGGLTNVSGTLYFTADSGSGSHLWKSNGTSAGTELVKDMDGDTIDFPSGMTNVNGTLFFRAFQGSTGFELWKSDGTSAGTSIVKDIVAKASNSDPQDLINVNGTLFFRATTPGIGFELWKSDGTSAGTQLVKDIRSGAYGSYIYQMTNVNGTLFFSANDGTNGHELWKTDGTSAGTQLVKDIASGLTSSVPTELTNVNGTLFFGAYTASSNYELWKSDGTSAGTELVKNIHTAGPGDVQNLTNVDGTLFFSANNGTNGRELWRSDGSSAGTQLVEDIDPGTDDSNPNEIVNVNGTLFFTANDGLYGSELWISDGTSFGTYLVKDIRAGGNGSQSTGLTNLNGTLFFAANNNLNGTELWVVDLIEETPLIVTGTDAGGPGTLRVFDTAGNELWNAFPYTVDFTGGVRVATGDINGDGILDIVTAAGPGGGPHIQVFDSETETLITGGPNNFYAYAPNVTVGVFVAVGDVNDDGFDDIITSADAGGGPHIKVFSGVDGSVITEFYAYAPEVTVGVRIATGDIDGNGTAEIITSPGPGGGPHIRVFSGTTGMQMPGAATNFYAYAPNVLTGVYVASGDLNNDGLDDIITAPGAGGGPHVLAFSSADASILQNFYAYDPAFTGGVRVASADINLDGFADIITVPGPSGGPHVRVFDGTDASDVSNFYSGLPDVTDGLFVAGGVGMTPYESPVLFSAPFPLVLETQNSDPPQDLVVDPIQKKKSWLDEADEFYASTEEIDKLFSGLGIE